MKPEQTLLSNIEKLAQTDLVLAYSGGVDSALLLKLLHTACQKKGTACYPVIVDSTLGDPKEVKEAVQLAQTIGCLPTVLNANPLESAGIQHNPINRCYLCKRYLFGLIVDFAKDKGITTIVDGTNADDLTVYRPGIKALSEYGIKSPLAEANMSKVKVRQLAGARQLSVSQKPSSPCMATRFPYGALLTLESFQSLIQAERYLQSLGFYNVRVRKYDVLARIEVDAAHLERIVALKDEIIPKMKTFGFIYVTLDLEGFRSGSMDLIEETK